MDAEVATSSVMNDMLDAEASLDTLFLTGPQPRMSRDAPDPGPALRTEKLEVQGIDRKATCQFPKGGVEKWEEGLFVSQILLQGHGP
jgi:hypothetical protein